MRELHVDVCRADPSMADVHRGLSQSASTFTTMAHHEGGLATEEVDAHCGVASADARANRADVLAAVGVDVPDVEPNDIDRPKLCRKTQSVFKRRQGVMNRL